MNGLSIFYREAGSRMRLRLLSFTDFRSSSRMYEPLFTRLADAFHLVAPDYPGFGHSAAPDPTTFAYTFDNLAEIIERFTELMGLDRYSLFVQDYGGPVRFRLAMAHPDRLDALVIQNAVAHKDGLGPRWQTRRDFWADRASNETALRRTSCPSMPPASGTWELARTLPVRPRPLDRRVRVPEPSRPGRHPVDLFYDYRTNVASYPAWQGGCAAASRRSRTVGPL